MRCVRILAGLVVLCIQGPALGQQDRPAPAKDFVQSAIDWETSRLVSVYQSNHPAAGPKDVADIEVFVRGFFSAMEARPGAPSFTEVSMRWPYLRDKKLNDPLVDGLC